MPYRVSFLILNFSSSWEINWSGSNVCLTMSHGRVVITQSPCVPPSSNIYLHSSIWKTGKSHLSCRVEKTIYPSIYLLLGHHLLLRGQPGILYPLAMTYINHTKFPEHVVRSVKRAKVETVLKFQSSERNRIMCQYHLQRLYMARISVRFYCILWQRKGCFLTHLPYKHGNFNKFVWH